MRDSDYHFHTYSVKILSQLISILCFYFAIGQSTAMATLANPLILRCSKHFSNIARANRSIFSCQFNNFVNCLASTRTMSDSKGQVKRCLDLATINPCIKTMEYAVR
jgi:hypothetical protein